VISNLGKIEFEIFLMKSTKSMKNNSNKLNHRRIWRKPKDLETKSRKSVTRRKIIRQTRLRLQNVPCRRTFSLVKRYFPLLTLPVATKDFEIAASELVN
jgi:hypothetical protein